MGRNYGPEVAGATARRVVGPGRLLAEQRCCACHRVAVGVCVEREVSAALEHDLLGAGIAAAARSDWAGGTSVSALPCTNRHGASMRFSSSDSTSPKR
jgi:hypothetical protein